MAIWGWHGLTPPQFIFSRREYLGIALEPPDHKPGSWIGAGKALFGERGEVLLTARPRVAEGGARGYEAAIYESGDGLHFGRVGGLSKEEVSAASGLKIHSIEGTQLVRDPTTLHWHLYLSVDTGESFIWGGLHWQTLLLASPSLQGPWTSKGVVLASDRSYDRFQARDSSIDIVDGQWLCIYKAMDDQRVVRPALASSADGVQWRKHGVLSIDGQERRAFLNGSLAAGAQGPVFLGLESSLEDTVQRAGHVEYADKHGVGHGGSDTYAVAYRVDRSAMDLQSIYREYWHPGSAYEHHRYPLLGYSSVVYDSIRRRFLLYVEAIDDRLTTAIGLNGTVERLLVYQTTLP